MRRRDPEVRGPPRNGQNGNGNGHGRAGGGQQNCGRGRIPAAAGPPGGAGETGRVAHGFRLLGRVRRARTKLVPAPTRKNGRGRSTPIAGERRPEGCLEEHAPNCGEENTRTVLRAARARFQEEFRRGLAERRLDAASLVVPDGRGPGSRPCNADDPAVRGTRREKLALPRSCLREADRGATRTAPGLQWDGHADAHHENTGLGYQGADFGRPGKKSLARRPGVPGSDFATPGGGDQREPWVSTAAGNFGAQWSARERRMVIQRAEPRSRSAKTTKPWAVTRQQTSASP